MDWRGAAAFVEAVDDEVRTNNVTFVAGSIAHSAFLSLLPLLLLLLVVVAAVGNGPLHEAVVGLARDYLGPVGQGLLFEALTSASETGRAPR